MVPLPSEGSYRMIRPYLSRSVLAVALLGLVAGACPTAAAETVYKPVRSGNAGALVCFEAGRPEACDYMWYRAYKKNGEDQWELDKGPHYAGSGDVPFGMTFSVGEYQVEAVCHSTDAEPPTSGWATCVYVVAYDLTLRARRKGSTANFGTEATIAAGGKDPDVHKAELEVTASPAIAGIPVDVNIVAGTGQGKDGTGGAATLDMASETTDANGKATGTFTSSNKTEEVRLQSHPTEESLNSEIVIHQQWDHENGGEWEYNGWSIPNAYSDVSWTLQIDDGGQSVPITGHTAKFYAQRVVYYEWDDVLSDYVEYEEKRGPDNNWDLSFYSEFNPPQTQDSTPGVYTSAQIVYEDDVHFDWFVDVVEFRGVDDDTYVR